MKIPFRKLMMTLALGLIAVPTSAQIAVAPPLTKAQFGVNLAGAEFGGDIPGTFERTYIYPPVSALDYYRSKGLTLIRLPFRWERMQRTLNSPLDADELARLKTVLRAARERDMQIVIDVHNYGRYRFPGETWEQQAILGDARLPYSAFADLWRRLATELRDEGVDGYGLMNEPHDMGDLERWPRAAQAAIDAIRSADKQTPIYVSGDAWSSATSWRRGPNENLHEKVRDPQNNLVFEAHCYFDKDLSGSYKNSYDAEARTPDTGVENVRPFVEWCREKGVRGFIGEYGVPDTDTRWLVTMDRFLSYLNANGISSAYWAGGPWWNDYVLAIEPRAIPRDEKNPSSLPTLFDRPQMIVLRGYGARNEKN